MVFLFDKCIVVCFDVINGFCFSFKFSRYSIKTLLYYCCSNKHGKSLTFQLLCSFYVSKYLVRFISCLLADVGTSASSLKLGPSVLHDLSSCTCFHRLNGMNSYLAEMLLKHFDKNIIHFYLGLCYLTCMVIILNII